jgi:hypothetical protein
MRMGLKLGIQLIECFFFLFFGDFDFFLNNGLKKGKIKKKKYKG